MNLKWIRWVLAMLKSTWNSRGYIYPASKVILEAQVCQASRVVDGFSRAENLVTSICGLATGVAQLHSVLGSKVRFHRAHCQDMKSEFTGLLTCMLLQVFGMALYDLTCALSAYAGAAQTGDNMVAKSEMRVRPGDGADGLKTERSQEREKHADKIGPGWWWRNHDDGYEDAWVRKP
jgi:hypothetical protein